MKTHATHFALPRLNLSMTRWAQAFFAYSVNYKLASHEPRLGGVVFLLFPDAELWFANTQALRHMKHLHDEGAQPDEPQQRQIVLSARQQLALDSQLATPQLPTPPQPSAGLLTPPTTPGLGYAPASSQLNITPAVTPATTPTAAKMSQQPSAVSGGSQLQILDASLASDRDRLQQQHPSRQKAEVGTGSNSSLRQEGTTKHWQGGLYSVSTSKGEEFVCELVTDAWPAHLPRCALPGGDIRTMH